MERIEALPPAKRPAILSAGFACFGRNGYRKASMADIAEAAGISKASLFHYFGSKQALYAALYAFSADIISRTISDALTQGASTDDFFDRIVLAQELKLNLMTQYPHMFEFLWSGFQEEDPALEETLRESNIQYIKRGYASLLAHVNWDKFKPELSREMIMNAVNWIGEGYLRTQYRQSSIEGSARELLAYLQLLRQAFYKEEYLNERH